MASNQNQLHKQKTEVQEIQGKFNLEYLVHISGSFISKAILKYSFKKECFVDNKI